MRLTLLTLALVGWILLLILLSLGMLRYGLSPQAELHHEYVVRQTHAAVAALLLFLADELALTWLLLKSGIAPMRRLPSVLRFVLIFLACVCLTYALVSLTLSSRAALDVIENLDRAWVRLAGSIV